MLLGCRSSWKLTLCAAVIAVALAGASWSAEQPSVAGYRTLQASHAFDVLLARLEKAVTDNRMAVVASASASRGAAARGVKIAGNAVIMVFRNDYAVRMLEASVAAGIEAPLRFYVTENGDGTASLSYRTPRAVFAPYAVPALDALAKELDAIFEKIANDALGR